MKAVSRIVLAMAAAGLGLAPVPALAQSAPDATVPPAAETVGPRELQNFNLNGTVTRQADAPPAAAAPAPRTRTPPQTPPSAARTVGANDTAAAPPARRPATQAAAAPRPAAPPPLTPGQSLTLGLPDATTATLPQPGFSPGADARAPALAPDEKGALWPWLLLAGVIGAGGAFLLWRRRSREAFAGGPQVDAFVSPEPAPRRVPPASPPEAPPPKPVGIVSTRLRPWIDLSFVPLGCLVDDERVTVEFEVEVVNSGSAPARDILIEASMFNAGPTQDQDIGAFFAKPAGQGDRIASIAPLQNIAIRTSLVAPRENIRLFELAGKKVFVPLVAFNALYHLAGGSGQTSVAYMLGLETRTDKLGPLRVDLGARAYKHLDIRPMPIGIRT